MRTAGFSVVEDLSRLLGDAVCNPSFPLPDGLVACADARTVLAELDAETADLVFLDPPFNLGKRYGKRTGQADKKDPEEYWQFLSEVIEHSVRILKPGGALYVYHIPVWALRIGSVLDQSLNFRHWIAVSMKNGFPKGGLYPAHYGLLFFTKGEPSRLNRPKIPAPRCRSCGEYIKDYGGYAEHVANGINLSDIWDDFSPVRHPANKNRTANELPLGLVRRILEISGVRGGLLVDPFVGSGTSLVAAREAGMRFLGVDREESCCAVALERLNEAQT